MTTTTKINLQSHTQATSTQFPSPSVASGQLSVLWLFGVFFLVWFWVWIFFVALLWESVVVLFFGFFWVFFHLTTSILGVVSLVFPYLFDSALVTLAPLAFNKTFYFGQLLWPNATTTPATNAKLLNTP